MSNQEVYLKAILATIARQTFPPEALSKLVAPTKAGDRQLVAYNLCDGSRSQTEIAKELGLDAGAFSRTVSRWVDLGILVRVGEKRETRLVHLYPLPIDIPKRGKGEMGDMDA